MQDFLASWNEAATTSIGFFWMALWAFILGYVISSLIQVLVTRERMQEAMGREGPRSMALGTFFGFLSSSCSFSALATTRAARPRPPVCLGELALGGRTAYDRSVSSSGA